MSSIDPSQASMHVIHIRPLERLPARSPESTRFVLVSDTHTHTFPVPDGDILLHAGDLTEGGSNKELKITIDWLCGLPHKHKIIIAGNHDYCLDEQTLLQLQATYDKHRPTGKQRRDAIEPVNSEIYDEAIAIVRSPEAQAAGLIYLQDDVLEIPASEGSGRPWRIWGSPWSAAFCSMAFNIPRGGPSADLYGQIPDDIDILMTHGPPFGILDRIAHGGRCVGCEMLLQRTQAIKPRLHVWGHIHEDRGVLVDEEGGDGAGTGTVYVNAANAGTFARPRRWGTHEYQPIVVDLRNP